MKEEDFMFIDLIESGAIEYAGLNEEGEAIYNFTDKLKDINLLNTDGQEDTTSIGLVEKRGGEGPEGVGDSTESDD